MAEPTQSERRAVGLCGLGQMGLAVAGRLATSFDVTAYDPSAERRTLADDLAAVTAVDELERLRSQRTVVLSLPSPPVSREVCVALAELLEPGSLVIETSTVLPSDVTWCGQVLRDAGSTLIDAAILSGVGQMGSGAATLLVGGSDTDVATAEAVLGVLGRHTQRFGDLGTGMAAKVVNNGVAHAVMVVLIEGFAMAKTQGLELEDIATMLEAPDGGLIRPLTHRMMERVAGGNFEGGMPLDAARKDSTLALAMAQDTNVPLYATQAAQTVYDLGVAKGLGRSDYAAIASLWEEWCGISLAYGNEEGQR